MTSSNDNEKIVVHDASILRSNEHPKFKIGDVINNGHGDFIVKGFTRSFMGLAYVLDNGHKLIGWLTEQVDAKCHLVERNHSEYIRKDFFIKKACDAYCKVCGHYPHTTPNHICRQACDYYKDFVNYMKGG